MFLTLALFGTTNQSVYLLCDLLKHNSAAQSSCFAASLPPRLLQAEKSQCSQRAPLVPSFLAPVYDYCLNLLKHLQQNPIDWVA